MDAAVKELEKSRKLCRRKEIRDMKKMIYGVDLGWATQLEAQGFRWLDEAGEEKEILAASKELGVNAVRLRIFVDPPEEAFWQKQEDEALHARLLRCKRSACDGGKG